MVSFRAFAHALQWAAIAVATVSVGSPSSSPAVEPLPTYQMVSGVEGNLNSIGSDTLNILMTHWTEAFRKMYPNVRIQVEGKGSATAPPALSRGVAQLGPISRRMRDEEEEAFETRHGFRPTCVSVALDCVAVYVHRENPIAGLTFEQIDGIFSKTRLSGSPELQTWGDLGLTGTWADLPISLYGRNSASGTYAHFKQQVMRKGDYKDTVKEQPGSAGVVQAVGSDRAGIGYSGIGYKTSDVRIVPLAKSKDATFVEPTIENAAAGRYPLGRALYIYVAKRPGKPLPKVNEEFLKFVLSKQGQDMAVEAGYGALPQAVVSKQVEVLK